MGYETETQYAEAYMEGYADGQDAELTEEIHHLIEQHHHHQPAIDEYTVPQPEYAPPTPEPPVTPPHLELEPHLQFNPALMLDAGLLQGIHAPAAATSADGDVDPYAAASAAAATADPLAPPVSADTDPAAAATGPKIMIAGGLRVTPHGAGGVEVYMTFRNDGEDLPEQSGAQTYIQVVGADGNTIVDRRVGMGQALAKGATHFGGDTLQMAPQACTVFVYTNYKDDGSYDDLQSADFHPGVPTQN